MTSWYRSPHVYARYVQVPVRTDIRGARCEFFQVSVKRDLAAACCRCPSRGNGLNVPNVAARVARADEDLVEQTADDRRQSLTSWTNARSHPSHS